MRATYYQSLCWRLGLSRIPKRWQDQYSGLHLKIAANCPSDFQNTNYEVYCLITREDAAPKPHPESLYKICHHLKSKIDEAPYVGDYLYELQAGQNEGI
jgi:phosphoglycolate phosphatase-like HAD superfamily hydrolase